MNKTASHTKVISILSVSALQEDHGVLEAIFRQHLKSGQSNEPAWIVYTGATLESALTTMRQNKINIVISERDCAWKDLLEETATTFPHPPLMIVSSRLVDARLWGEVLNLGGWDVLAKPFEPTEVVRVVESAWRHWIGRRGLSASAVSARRQN